MRLIPALMTIAVSFVLACGTDANNGGNNQNDNNNNGPSVCGNGFVETGEQCDLGSQNSDSTPDGCRTDCRDSYCGDDVQDSDEACDDGDDDSNPSDACPATCLAPVCGDGHTWLGHELCDDGNTAGGDGCSGDCQVDEGQCGDGFVDQDLGEECDDQNTAPDDGCSPSCQVEWGWICTGLAPSSCHTECGDGVIALGEEACDDGNTHDGDGCGAGCDVELGWACTGEPSNCEAAACGDGMIAGAEACDDGNTASADGCDAQCAIETGWGCWGEPSFCELIVGSCPTGYAFIPAGPFQMGCSPLDTQCGQVEPLHTVTLSGYCLKVTEVTVAEYQLCASAMMCTAPDTGVGCTWGVAGQENHPVNCVDWAQAQTYCQWAAGGGGDLPTEAQWEKGARGATDTRIYPWGDNGPFCAQANAYGCVGATWEVGTASPTGDSPYGISDMSGNVEEWVRDRYKGDYYIACDCEPAQICNIDPLNDCAGSTNRVLRGGVWEAPGEYLHVSFRNQSGPANRSHYIGFRCSKTP